jgi:hypothetical protein
MYDAAAVLPSLTVGQELAGCPSRWWHHSRFVQKTHVFGLSAQCAGAHWRALGFLLHADGCVLGKRLFNCAASNHRANDGVSLL